MKSALLLSGGVDSTALAWWRRPDVAYTINYGQAAADAETRTARAVCKTLGCKHHIIEMDLSSLGTGPMAGRPSSSLSAHQEWWPFRNQLLLTFAGMHAVQHGIRELMIGTVRSDKRHADGKPVFVRRVSALMSGQEGGIGVSAPAMGMSSLELIQRSSLPNEALLWTHSCHRGNTHCCSCAGCKKRLMIFGQLGLAE